MIFRLLLLWVSCLVLDFLSPSILRAQTAIHRFNLQEVSYEYLNLRDNRKRCLRWGPIVDTSPTLLYARDGRVFTTVEIQAMATAGCEIKVDLPERVNVIREGNGRIRFQFTVVPPASTFVIESDSTVDRVLIDAPYSRIDESGFFSVFKRSQVYFETRYTTLETDSSEVDPSNRKAVMVPVTGGRISFPVPWVPFVLIGVEMHQNVGNIFKANSGASSYNELAADIQLQYLAPEKWGRASLGLIFDFRGRNVVQRSANNPISLNFAVSGGAGLDFQSFFPSVWVGEGAWLRRLGLEASFRYYPPVQNNGPAYSPRMFGAGLLYRFDNKWAMSLGYSRISYSLDYRNTPSNALGVVNESLSSFYLRLHLMPFLFEKKEGL